MRAPSASSRSRLREEEGIWGANKSKLMVAGQNVVFYQVLLFDAIFALAFPVAVSSMTILGTVSRPVLGLVDELRTRRAPLYEDEAEPRYKIVRHMVPLAKARN